MIVLILLFCVSMFYLLRYIRWQHISPNYKGKSVFITGGSSGIGEALAKQFVKYGAKKVIIAARRLNELERVK